MYKSGCIICGDELTYSQTESKIDCIVCHNVFETNVQCVNNHYVCDACHESDAIDYIEDFCRNSTETDPSLMIRSIMRNPKIKLHGPEHHFLVPAVLLTCYYNITNTNELLSKKLTQARKRSNNVLGGFCGFYGACGAGIGTGIFLSLIQDSTPLSVEEWKQGNLLTSKSLEVIANNGGPSCCKRDSFLAVETSVAYLNEHFKVKMPLSGIQCSYSNYNNECKGDACRYYSGKT